MKRDPLCYSSFDSSQSRSEKKFCVNCSRVFTPGKVLTVHYTSRSHSTKNELCPLCKKRDLYLVMQTNAYMREMNRSCTIQDLLKRFEDDIEIHYQYFKDHFTMEECSTMVKKVILKDVYRWLEEGILRILKEKRKSSQATSNWNKPSSNNTSSNDQNTNPKTNLTQDQDFIRDTRDRTNTYSRYKRKKFGR